MVLNSDMQVSMHFWCSYTMQVASLTVCGSYVAQLRPMGNKHPEAL